MPSFTSPGWPLADPDPLLEFLQRSEHRMVCSRMRRGTEKGMVGGRFNTTLGILFFILFFI